MDKIRSKSKNQEATNKYIKGRNEEENFFDNILDIDISKPRNAFALFSSNTRVVYDKSKGIGARTVIVSERWSKLSMKEKEVYGKKAEEEVKRYEKNLALVKKFLLNPDKLKDSRTPYALFKDVYVHNYMNDNDVGFRAAAEQARIEWNSLSISEKDVWKDQLEKEKETLAHIKNFKPGFKKAYALYVHDRIVYDNLNRTEAMAEWSIVSQKIKEKYEKKAAEENEANEKLRDLYEIANGLKPKRPNGPIAIFMAELSQTNIATKNFIQEGYKRYEELSDEKKLYYEKQSKILQLKYSIKKTEFNKANPEKLNKTPTGYQLWLKDSKDRIKINDEGFNIGEFSSKAYETWLKEPEHVREDYKKRSMKLKEDSIEATRFDDKPEKPLGPYIAFSKSYLEENKNKSLKGLLQKEKFIKVGEAWEKLSEKEKNVYKYKYEKELEIYNKEMAEYAEKLELNFKNKKNKSQSKFREQIQSKRLKSASKRMSSKSKSKGASQIMTQPKKDVKVEDIKQRKKSKSTKKTK
jgi:hypothetical protein